MSNKSESGRNFFSAPKELLRRFPLNYEFAGGENIDKARELLARGITVVAILDHKSFADLISGAMVTVKEGFDDLVKKANIIAKITYVEGFPSRQLLRNFKFRPVVPHTMPDYPSRDEINAEAKRWVQELPEGSILVMAPEGTRVKDGSMTVGRYGASEYWHGNGQRHLLPVAIEGTEKQWPRGALGFFKYFGGGFRIKSRFIVGEPVSVVNVDEAAEAYAGGRDNEEFTRLKTDLAMFLIAQLHQDPKYKGTYYVQLEEDLRSREIAQDFGNIFLFRQAAVDKNT
ncbi:MAG: 1-acyl-sn-glycerol-3-phosphate acyltransferase [Patescibacteria group bacterium]